MEERFYPVEDFCNNKVPVEKDEKLVERIKNVVDGKSSQYSKISVMGVGYTKSKKGFEGRQVYLSGGLNGNGLWSDYLRALAEIVWAIETEFKDEVENVVLANMEFDLLDDIFYPVIDIVWSYDRMDEGE